MKSDTSIKNICIAAVKRHMDESIDLLLSTLYDNDQSMPLSDYIDYDDGELPISRTLVDRTNWTLITTRRIVSCFNGQVQEAAANKVKSWHWGNFKGYNSGQTILGEIKLEDGNVLNVYIEVGKASMIIIYSIMTLVGQLKN